MAENKFIVNPLDEDGNERKLLVASSLPDRGFDERADGSGRRTNPDPRVSESFNDPTADDATTAVLASADNTNLPSCC